jgi:hypothetical protein
MASCSVAHFAVRAVVSRSSGCHLSVRLADGSRPAPGLFLGVTADLGHPVSRH